MMTVAASWDQDAMLAYGTAMGKEFNDKVLTQCLEALLNVSVSIVVVDPWSRRHPA